MKSIRIPVANEGVPFILFAAFATVIMALLNQQVATLTGLAVTAFVLYFFRDPSRIVPNDDLALISPADGRIIVIDPKVHDDRFLMADVQKISIFMNVFDVHVNRTPITGTVEQIIYSSGKFYSADSMRAGLENETCALILSTIGNRRLACVQMAGLIARRIVCWAEKGDTLTKGSRFGMIRFGSRVDLYLPAELRIEVKNGQRVKAGETILGRFPL
ncbi:MAG: phosphatidylserine decarboxylase family protein [Proteobacteria bacterium]|nr:phosphatidylserine decarboxylase family protein [Desulfobulbaceae bacterium]MBU4151247.1 phosphatidylserine decarboxylase family protein [Pseudomonadota bacterium]MDP2107353.1 phosphatidylserine decarboxylase family protein [Desulfobulbaceae bacterium]